MLVQTRPTKLKKPEPVKQDITSRPNQDKSAICLNVFWEMSAQDALKVNYLIYEHQSIQE